MAYVPTSHTHPPAADVSIVVDAEASPMTEAPPILTTSTKVSTASQTVDTIEPPANAPQLLVPNQAAKERPDGKGTFFGAGGAILREFDKSRSQSRRPSRPSSPPSDLQPTAVSGIGGKVSKPDYSELKIVVAMVGLPARGKSYLSNKLTRYLKWLEYDVEVFNVGQLRRSKARAKKEKSGITEDHTASYFSHSDDKASQLREALAEECLENLISWLKKGGNVAIHEFLPIMIQTPRTAQHLEAFREKIAARVAEEPGLVTLFLESCCDDPAVIAANIALKVSSGDPDYAHMSREDAERDFRNRIKHYEEVYETMTEPHLSYVKIINIGSQVQMYRIHGYLQSRIAFYLMNLHLKPRSIFMSRHGESQFNVEGKIGGDAPLSARGRQYASALPKLVRDNIKDAELTVWTSTLQRTIETAAQLPYPKLTWKSLDELDAGVCDGMTYEEIEAAYPEDFEARDDDKFNYRYRGGESYRDVVVRLEPVIMELERQDNVLVIGHQAIIRCLYAYFHNLSQEELPYINIPLHTVIKLTPKAYGCDEERYTLPIGAVSTHRPKPKNSGVKPPVAAASSARDYYGHQPNAN
ncbi:Bifunctional 6-phosphofructo-2-kinase fructose-2,6-bisphosphate 2-phosphatase [Rhizoctonia solani]|uniref:fructose-2,6-bisphosphate 2-phosphatase n=1 Tax=Rhizoctonia solani TaxID=456999 RepID=A0A8H7HDM1_9AGAM|nr:Bifunctional 6-phosphofructo-2-kinase fructose-2,6-bisphosphate 2-phosphatase [Rhizoctonia solani]